MFLAHANDLDKNFKKPLAQFQNKKALANDHGFKLANNVCPHQGSLILQSTQKKFKCQYHAWEWDNSGVPISSGTTKICNNFNLSLKSVFEENGLLFTAPVDLSSLPVDFTKMKLIEERIDAVNADYKNIIDLFLDVDHIPVVHEGVYDVIGIEGQANVEWEYYDWGSIQKVNPSTGGDQLVAAWITVYPYTMIEWQPGALFVTVCVPKETSTDVCVFKYRDDEDKWEMNERIWESAWSQDCRQSSAIVKFSNNTAHLEEGKLHFRSWIENNEIRL